MERIETFDVIAYLESRGIEYRTGGKDVSKGWIGVRCVYPYCDDEAFHLGIHLESKIISCWKCSNKGNIISFIMRSERVSFDRAKHILDQFQNIELIKGKTVEKQKNNSKVLWENSFSKTFPQMYKDFLISRRYDPNEVIRKYDLYSSGFSETWRNRLIIPIFYKGTMVSFIGRDVTKQAEISYKNCAIENSIIQPKHTLYNFDRAKRISVVVEGVFDAWRIGDGAVATFGTKYTYDQVLLLQKFDKVFIMFDADAKHLGEKLAYDASSLVKSVEVLNLSEGDPDNLTNEEVSSLRKDIGL